MEELTLGVPEELLKWARDKAAHETLRRGERISINTFILEIIRREMEADLRRKKIKSLTGNQCQGYG